MEFASAALVLTFERIVVEKAAGDGKGVDTGPPTGYYNVILDSARGRLGTTRAGYCGIGTMAEPKHKSRHPRPARRAIPRRPHSLAGILACACLAWHPVHTAASAHDPRHDADQCPICAVGRTDIADTSAEGIPLDCGRPPVTSIPEPPFPHVATIAVGYDARGPPPTTAPD